MTNGFEHALLLDEKGGATSLTYEQIKNYNTSDGLLWVHFDYKSSDAIDWITKKSEIDPIAVEALLAEETRPRTTILEDSILLALRGVNLNTDSDPEDMVSIRIFANKNLIISTKRRNLLSVNDVVDFLKKGEGPTSISQILVELTDRLTSRMESIIDGIDERADILEESLLSSNSASLRSEISAIRREAITLRRYLFPQKEAMFKLYHDKITWINEYEKLQLREITDQLIRHIEELDTIKDKVALIQEELVNKLSEEMNMKMYVLSIISAIFLPLGFLTGLLGINIGGIPGSDNPYAFYIFIGILLFLTIGIFMFFKKKKWI